MNNIIHLVEKGTKIHHYFFIVIVKFELMLLWVCSCHGERSYIKSNYGALTKSNIRQNKWRTKTKLLINSGKIIFLIFLSLHVRVAEYNRIRVTSLDSSSCLVCLLSTKWLLSFLPTLICMGNSFRKNKIK